MADLAAEAVVLEAAEDRRHGDAMKRKRIRLTVAEQDRIKAAVRKAESQTSGEIVPFIVASSDDYAWVHLVWGIAGWIGSCFILLFLRSHSQWALELGQILLIQWSGVVMGAMFPLVPIIKRSSIPKSVLHHSVHREVMASFVSAGLTETAHRTGILIYLSVLERRIEILADKGIDSKTPKGYWQSHVDTIVKGIHSGRPAEVLAEVIEKIGQELATAFPRSADDINELSDEIHTEPET